MIARPRAVSATSRQQATAHAAFLSFLSVSRLPHSPIDETGGDAVAMACGDNGLTDSITPAEAESYRTPLISANLSGTWAASCE